MFRIDGDIKLPHLQTDGKVTRHGQNPYHGEYAPNDLQKLFHIPNNLIK